jgi:mutator protein MutT
MKDVTKKRAVTILLHNEDGDILGVSRKTEHADVGLPGGKVDDGETDEEAIIREVKEETGLQIFDVRPYFEREDAEYICTTFIGNYKGEIITSEKGKVVWTDWATLKSGSFGKYNTQLEEFFNFMHKYKPNDIVVNNNTGEEFRIIEIVGYQNAGYLVAAFCSIVGYGFVKKSAIDNIRMHKLSEIIDDFVYTIDNLFVDTPQYFALSFHFDVNQYYGNNNCFLYSYHLKKTVDVGIRFKSEIPDEDWKDVEAGLWNHDNIEDARKTYNDLKKAIGQKGADIAFALTNSAGKTRSDRADAKYYEKIRETKYATFGKLCDRIANLEYSFKIKSPMAAMYKKEHDHFKQELHITGIHEAMWNHIEDLLFAMD